MFIGTEEQVKWGFSANINIGVYKVVSKGAPGRPPPGY